jgi:virginiamycin B lyase
VWFVDRLGGAVGSVATDGSDPRRITLGTNSGPNGITVGPDGNLWVTATDANTIARVTPSGTVTHFALPRFMGALGIVAGPDGNLWFAGAGGNAIGRITTAGDVTVFELPQENSFPTSVAVGSDGAIWFTESRGHRIGRLTVPQ